MRVQLMKNSLLQRLKRLVGIKDQVDSPVAVRPVDDALYLARLRVNGFTLNEVGEVVKIADDLEMNTGDASADIHNRTPDDFFCVHLGNGRTVVGLRGK